MADLLNTCPICERNILKHWYFMLCNCCHRHVHRNCTAHSCDEFTFIKNSALWFCRICNENIFPFNNIDDENEFQLTIQDFGRCSLNTTYQSLYVDSKIFDPFEINENDDNIIEYQGELDPDKNYFNQLAHHLSRSSNYYSEDTLNKLICQKDIRSGVFSLLHANIRSLPDNVSSFMSYMNNINLCFSVIGFSETWLSPFTIDTYGMNGYNHVGLTRTAGKGGGVSLYIAEKLAYTELPELGIVDDCIECVFARVHINGQAYIVGVVYRPPNSNVMDFNSTMHAILEKVTQYPCYIMGDFNHDLLKHDKHLPTEKKHPTIHNIHRYKQYRNRLTSLLKYEEKQFYQRQIIENKNNLRKVWTIIKQVVNKNKGNKISDQFIMNDRKETDPNMIANGFNNYFANIGPTLASKICTDNVSHRDFILQGINASLFLEPTNDTEIKLIIGQLKEGASGRDGIMPKHIKCVSESIAYPLTRMANLSFEQGVFPEELKLAIITPIYKAKDPMFFNNHRPISLLSVFSKILERLMYNRLLRFINRYNFFNKYQFGFRNKHSTLMALIILLENMTKALDDGKCAIGIFLDFQKAFDTVDHCILLDKLYMYGIRGIAHDWFLSYLSNRSQAVVYNNHESDFKAMKCGVPQGSILGPLLFLIYINDLPSVSNFFMPILFADDTNLFCTGKNLKDVVSQINVEIGKVYCWVKANKLSLNIDKTNFMLFTPKHFSRNMDGLLINGNQITEVNETKFLGVIIDNKLTWCPHIMYISKKIAKGIGIILKARKVFNNETLFSLYYTFVYPYLNYCIHVWGKAYDTHLRHLIVLQNKIIRIINGVPPRTNVENLYIKHNILSVKRLYSYNVGLFMYKYSNGLLPDVFDTLFCKLADVNAYNTRNASMQHIYVSFRSTNRGQKTLSYCGASIWNYILNKVNPKSAIGSFKKLIQNLFLLSNDNLFTWFRTCCCIIAPLISMFSTCVYMCELQISEYNCMSICTYIHMYLKVHAGSLTCKDSALLHRFLCSAPLKYCNLFTWYWGT